MVNDMKIGFIGAGNMASAIVGGAVKSGKFAPNDIYVCDINEEKVNKLKTELGVNAAADALELINSVDTVVLAVKPNVFPSLLPSVSKNTNDKGTFVISIAAGKSVAEINNLLGSNVPVARVMPNINATVLEAMSAYCCNALVNDEQKALVEKLCSSFGKVVSIEEDKFSIFSAIAGCSPAYAYMFIDSLARAGVKNGLAKWQALEIAAQTVLGSAKKILESNEHPWELVDRVCSPGGTTIEGVCALQENGFEATVTSAVDASYLKDKSL